MKLIHLASIIPLALARPESDCVNAVGAIIPCEENLLGASADCFDDTGAIIPCEDDENAVEASMDCGVDAVTGLPLECDEEDSEDWDSEDSDSEDSDSESSNSYINSEITITSTQDLKYFCKSLFEAYQDWGSDTLTLEDAIICMQTMFIDVQKMKRGKFEKKMKDKINLMSVKNTMKYIEALEEGSDESSSWF